MRGVWLGSEGGEHPLGRVVDAMIGDDAGL